jgi:hypothetical protein
MKFETQRRVAFGEGQRLEADTHQDEVVRMTGLSPAGETAVLAPLTTTAYVSLHTTDPGDSGTSEVAGSANSGRPVVRQRRQQSTMA